MSIKYVDILPKAAREALMKAAETPVTKHDPLARRKAVDRAIEWVKYQYPDYFTKELPWL
jgi:hypothetical protein